MNDNSSPNTQQKLLLAIEAHSRMHGYAPSIRDLQAACAISTTSVVTYHLARLRMRGLVDWIDGAARTIHVVRKAS